MFDSRVSFMDSSSCTGTSFSFVAESCAKNVHRDAKYCALPLSRE